MGHLEAGKERVREESEEKKRKGTKGTGVNTHPKNSGYGLVYSRQ